MQDLPPVSQSEAAVFDKEFADRGRTLLSVDDLVEAVVGALSTLGILDKTFIFYTSDHGFHLGPSKKTKYQFISPECAQGH